jgi:hypothetical protein
MNPMRGLIWLCCAVSVSPALALSRKDPPIECPDGALWKEASSGSGFSDEQGKPSRVGWCELPSGERHGPMRTWWSNGWLRSERYFERNLERGRAQTFFEDGKPRTDTMVVGGKMEGRFVQWHPNGHRERTMHYEFGRPHGWMSMWNESGQLVAQGAFAEGRKEGVWESWHDNGVLKDVARWEGGRLHGRQLQFGEGGAFVHGTCWDRGEKTWESKSEAESRTRRCLPW